jgi:hypothetical protein
LAYVRSEFCRQRSREFRVRRTTGCKTKEAVAIAI